MFLQSSSASAIAGARSRFVVSATLLAVAAYVHLPKEMKELHTKVTAST